MPKTPLIVSQNVASLHAEPDTSSGLVSQALLGDRILVTQEQDGFSHVMTADLYQGWMASRLLIESADRRDALLTTVATLFAEIYTAPDAHSELLTKLAVGTHIVIAPRPEIGDWIPVQLPDTQIGYIHRVSLNVTYSEAQVNIRLALEKGLPRISVVSAIGRQAADAAKRLIGTPYLWGGCTPFGIDCSGLTQLAYKLNGIQLLRDAHLQFADRRFTRVEEGLDLETALLEDGDLVVFSRREDKRPTHIGLALGDGRFIHARGGQGVRIDFCWEPDYRQTYLGAVRLSADADFAVEAA